MRTQGIVVIALQFLAVGLAENCIQPTPLTLQLILEYSKFRAWDEVVMFTDFSSKDCIVTYARPLLACLSASGIGISFQRASNPNVPDALGIRGHRIGAIVILDGLNLTSPHNVLHVASHKQLYSYYVSWLMITVRSTDATIDTIIRDLNIGIDSDVVVATSPLDNNAASKVLQRWNKTCPAFRRYATYYKPIAAEPDRKRLENVALNLDYVRMGNKTTAFYLIHVYKIRTANNASLVTHFLGTWNPGATYLKKPVSVKLRDDFQGHPIIFGVLNGTSSEHTEDSLEANDVTPLMDFAEFLTSSLNASMETVPYEKLGSLTNKAWTHLLGDITQGTVDVGLGYITISDDKLADMSFSHTLIRYMRNIYYQPLETSTMRDIFLRPFNSQLFACVAVTYIIILLAMVVIIHIAKIILNGQNEKVVGYGEAALCCISVMCMQGSTWSPKSLSGKTLLLFSLMFALVTYNAYAGFITSTLSVQENGIKSIKDLLDNHFQLGYSAADDEYIRNANDPNLRLFYVKAFNNRETNLGTTSGLKRVVRERYAFFVSATLARRALETTVIQERCSIHELPLLQTFTRVALPMADACPYKKIIDLNILRIKERGVFSRIAKKMLPEMPRCTAPTTFNSARLEDVYSAFILLLGGIVIAFSIGIFERMWNKRKQMQESIVRGIREHHFIPHIHFHHHHHPHHHRHHGHGHGHYGDHQARHHESHHGGQHGDYYTGQYHVYPNYQNHRDQGYAQDSHYNATRSKPHHFPFNVTSFLSHASDSEKNSTTEKLEDTKASEDQRTTSVSTRLPLASSSELPRRRSKEKETKADVPNARNAHTFPFRH